MSTNEEPDTSPEPTEPTTTTPTEPTSAITEPAAPEAPQFDLTPVEALTDLVPEGFELDDEGSKEFLEIINGNNSRADLAKSLLSMYAKSMESLQTQQADLFKQTREAWRAEIAADPDYGGENQSKALARARETIETYGGTTEQVESFKKFLALTGAGDTIHMVRLINRLRDAVPGEASPVDGSAGQPTPQGRATRLFPSMQS